MKNLDLNAMGVEEMNENEVMSIDGGGWLVDAATWIEDKAEAAWEAVKKPDFLYGHSYS